MTDVIDIRSLMDAAEQAASRGDFASAGTALGRVVELQEAALGPSHPDLANTLNNLAIVNERLGKTGQAEACYRRSFAIAKASLAADHPLVRTSEENLRAFCEANGLAFEPPAARRAPAPPPIAQPAPARGASRTVSIATAIGLCVLAVLFLLRSRGSAPAPAGEKAGPPPVEAAAPPPSDTASPEPPVAQPPAVAAAVPSPAPPAPKPAPAVADTAVPAVVQAHMCGALDLQADWRCTDLQTPVAGGTVYFVTRLTSPADTTVEHRWYRGEKLQQSVRLRIPATRGGYRTYSRTSVAPERAGSWRVELRAANGTVLHEERFTVAP